MSSFDNKISSGGGSNSDITNPFLVQLGLDTDIGGGRENQDDYLHWFAKNIYVIGVLDGHGREIGKLAANTAKQSILELLIKEGEVELSRDPLAFIKKIFELEHKKI